MLSGIIQLPLSTGYVLAALMACKPTALPVVTLQFQNDPVQINHTKSSEDLTHSKENSLSPNYGTEFPIVGGVTSSDFRFKYKMNFGHISGSDQNNCLWIKDVAITLTYTPVIYISSNYKPGSCRYNLTQRHEMQHVTTDVITIRELLPYIKQATETSLAQWYTAGPFPDAKMTASQDTLSKRVEDIMKKVLENVQRGRFVRQQQVDSREEYNLMSTSCPHERIR